MRTVIRGGTLLAGHPARWQAGDVLIEADRIAALGDVDAHPDDRVVDASAFWVLPGFINAHLHSHDVFMRARYESTPLESLFFLNPSIHAPLSPREIYVRTALVGLEMLRSGFTSCIDTCAFHPLDREHVAAAMKAYRDVGIRAWVGPRLIDAPSMNPDLFAALPEAARGPLADANALSATDAVSLLQGLLSHADDRVKVAPMPSSPFRCSDEFIQALADFSRQHALPWQTHVLETATQARLSQRYRDGSMISHLKSLGVLSPRCGVVHAVWATQQELDIIGKAGAMVLHNPVCNLRFGSGIASLASMRQSGIDVALGTDNASCASGDPFDTMRFAALLSQVAKERLETPADVVLTAATSGGGKACLQPGLGVLRPGALADLVVLDPATSFLTPGADRAQHLVYHLTAASVRDVMVNGRLVIQGGCMGGIEEEDLRNEAAELSQKVATDHVRVAARAQGTLEALKALQSVPPDAPGTR